MFESILTDATTSKASRKANQKITLSFQYDCADTRLSRGQHTCRDRCSMPDPGTALAKTNFQESQRLLFLPLYIQPFALRMLCSCNLRNMAAVSYCGVGMITHRLVISYPSDRASRRKSQVCPCQAGMSACPCHDKLVVSTTSTRYQCMFITLCMSRAELSRAIWFRQSF